MTLIRRFAGSRRGDDPIRIADRPVGWSVYIYSVLLCWVLGALARTGPYAETLPAELLSGALFLGPLAPLLFPLRCASIDPSGRRMTFDRKWIWGRYRRRTISFDEIERAEVHETSTEERSFFRPRIVLKSGEFVSLVQVGLSESEAADIAAMVSQALRSDANGPT